MALSVKTSSGWRNASALVKVAGQWKEVSQLYVKQNGTWKPLWSYGWKEGAWSACSTTCGGGTQSREVTCQRSDGQPAPESLCDAATKPESSQSCNTQACINYSWVTGTEGVCSVKCGDGVRKRTVTCRRENANGSFTGVADSFCESAKPSGTVPCFAVCKWVEGAWTACKPGCGESVQERTIKCATDLGLGGPFVTGGASYAECFSLLESTAPDTTKPCTSCTGCARNEEIIVANKVLQLNATQYEGRTNWTAEEARALILQSPYGTQANPVSAWWNGVGKTEKICPFDSPYCCEYHGYIYHQ